MTKYHSTNKDTKCNTNDLIELEYRDRDSLVHHHHDHLHPMLVNQV